LPRTINGFAEDDMTTRAEDDPTLVSRNNARESERVPAGGDTPRSADTRVNLRGGPDPDMHPEAAANVATDEEAGAMPDEGGGITPLKEMAKQR
jgi:hypothetical protein